MERQTWSGGLGSWWDRVSLLTSVDVIDGRVKIVGVTGIMVMNIIIIVIVEVHRLVGITSWSSLVGGMDLVDVDVTLLSRSHQKLQISVKSDGLFGGLSKGGSGVLHSG